MAKPFLPAIALVFVMAVSGISFAATLSGTGCSTGGDCVVSANQTIDSGTTYYFNSLAVNPGVIVNVAGSGNGAGGSAWFYVAGDANISGSILADATTANFSAGGSANPNGGGYGGGGGAASGSGSGGAGSGGNGAASGNGCYAGSGGGVITIRAKRINLYSSSLLSANGGNGAVDPGNCYSGSGGGSGGTISLYGLSIFFNGTISATGGIGGGPGASSYGYGGGGGAGGSLIFMPLTISTLSGGSMYFSGGAGGSGSYGTGGQGGGSGRAGGSAGHSGGVANTSRNIRIYNSYVPSGSAFSISSNGGSPGTGLASLYFAPYSSKYSGLSWSYGSGDYAIGIFDSSLNPMAPVPVRITNSQNRSIIYFNGTTQATGIFTVNGGSDSSGFFAPLNSSTSLSQTVTQGDTATLSCPTGSSVSSYTSIFAYNCNPKPCGSCTLGADSCSVTYSFTDPTCQDPCPGSTKTALLAINCTYYISGSGNSTWHSVLVDNMPSSGYVAEFYGRGSAPSQSASYVPVSAGSHMLEVASLSNTLYGPDGLKKSSLFLVNNSAGELVCQGSTMNSSLNSSCLLARTMLDASSTRIQYSEIFTSPIYSARPQFSGMVMPNSVIVGGSGASGRLVGMASAPVMRAGSQYKRVIFYSPQSLAEGNFAYQETIPSDFAFGSNGTVYMAASDGSTSSCTFSMPVGKFVSVSSSNCPAMGQSIGYGGYLQLEYWIVAPAPDSFFTESKSYVFSEGSLSLQTTGG